MDLRLSETTEKGDKPCDDRRNIQQDAQENVTARFEETLLRLLLPETLEWKESRPVDSGQKTFP